MTTLVPPHEEFPNMLTDLEDGVEALNKQGIVVYGDLTESDFDVELTEKGTEMLLDDEATSTPTMKAFTTLLEALDTEDTPYGVLIRFLQTVKAHSATVDENLLREYYENASTLPADPIPEFPEVILMQFDPGIVGVFTDQ